MTKLIKYFFLFLAIFNGNSQIKKPVTFSTKTEKISEKEYNLIISGAIEKDWHVYSQFTPADGPLPITITFDNQKGNFELVGKAKESDYKKHFNDIFGVDEYYFENKFTITQKVKILNPKTTTIKLNFDYQVCKDACINDNKDFVFEIPQSIVPETVKPVEISNEMVINHKSIKKIDANINVNSSKITTTQRGLGSIFIFAFLGGLLALMTPCVFPMIPMTVSFFTKQSKNKALGIRNAIIYGISIIAIYVVLGLTITTVFGAGALNALATNVWFNILFFILLIIFAASFLGAFEIMLPNSWANKVDQQADKGGLIGIFFMALALAIVSFSCTGPIVGSLLVDAASTGGIAPIIGMLGFSSALALPFMLFAMFPAWLHSLPKSGGWLNTVKVNLGFLELALAFKFLSNADLVLQAHYLERETFLAIWVAIFGTWAMYLFGKISLPHDSPLPHISVGRLSFGIIILAFTIYMIPGLWGAPLNLINAFPPPQTYSESPQGIGTNINNSNENLPSGAEIGVHGLTIFTDYETGLAYSKTVHKPVLLDFTGHACVNCRKMENSVWNNPKILEMLNNQLVIISLVADDKRELPKNKQYTNAEGTKIETIGDKWTDFMITNYKTNTQPLYVIVDGEGNNMNPAMPTTSYDPDVTLYEDWLKAGIANFK